MNTTTNLFIEKIPCPAFIKDINSQFLYGNSLFIKAAGLNSLTELIGKTDHDMPWKKFAKKYQKDDREVIAKKLPKIDYDEKHQNHLIPPTSVCVSKYPLMNADNEVYAVLGIIADSRTSEEDEASLLNSIITHIPCYIFWKDKAGKFLGCNKQFAKSAGYKNPKSLIGKTDFDMPWKEQAAKYVQDDQSLIQSKKIRLDVEDVQTRQDGQEITALVSKVPLLNQDDQAYGVLGIYTDITERKKKEKMIEAASDAKSRFIANISHDIRTPLTGMIGLSQSIYKKTHDNSIKSDAKSLIMATNELLKLLNEVIEVVKIDSGDLKRKKEVFNLEALIHATMRLFQPSLDSKNIQCEFQYPKSLHKHFISYKTFLCRVLLNLVSNAVKFTGEHGQIKIIVRELTQSADISEIEIIIEDTGIGIPEEKQQLIFQHFSRLNPSYEGKFSGFGLGLYTVKNYLSAMNGDVTVKSEPGKGSQFTVRAPLTKADANALPTNDDLDFNQDDFLYEESADITDDSTTTENNGTKETITTPRANILIVEDHPLASNMVVSIFKSLQCTIDQAFNGEEALNLSLQSRYDLILMDIGLPDTDGITLTKKIKQSDQNPNQQTHIIALSGHISKEQNDECLKAGMSRMITKPLTLSVAKNLIAKQDATHTIIDLAAGAKLLQGNRAAAITVLDEFVKILPDELNVIQATFDSGDMTTLHRKIHRFYGGLCYLALPKLKVATHALHQKLLNKATTKQEAADLFHAFTQEISVFQKAYEQVNLT
jgi:two-component system, OmpR family, aerobic respiration control sensor histidine kinase ArcB